MAEYQVLYKFRRFSTSNGLAFMLPSLRSPTPNHDTNSKHFRLAFAAATDIGCRRANNEDSFGYNNDPHLYVVCDGVGGGAAGEVASGTAVRTLIESFEAQSPATDGTPEPPVESRLLHSIQEANRVVREIAQNNPEFQNMGTTLVCACLDGARMLIGNVGDSRAYLIRDGVGLQITQDHSLLDEQVRSGIITPEMAVTSNLQGVITRAIGAAETVEPDFFAAELHPDDILLLTTDGLTRYLQAGGDCVHRIRPGRTARDLS